MTEWYYSDDQRHQHGPLAVEAMARLHAEGVLQPDTLVWRDGLAQWTPWRELMASTLAEAGPTTTSIDTDSGWQLPDAADSAPSDGVMASPSTIAHSVADTGFKPTSNAEASPYAPTRTLIDVYEPGYVPGGPIIHAGLRKRFAAAFIDGIITTVMRLALVVPFFGTIMYGIAEGNENPMLGGLGLLGTLLLYPAILFLPGVYFAWMHASEHKASLGKMAVGIKVVRGDGRRIGFWRGFLRYVVYQVFALLTCGIGAPLISALMVALSERKQSLHDMICDTLVVDKHAFTEQKRLQREELDAVTIVVLVIAALLLLAYFGLMLVGIVAEGAAG